MGDATRGTAPEVGGSNGGEVRPHDSGLLGAKLTRSVARFTHCSVVDRPSFHISAQRAVSCRFLFNLCTHCAVDRARNPQDASTLSRAGESRSPWQRFDQRMCNRAVDVGRRPRPPAVPPFLLDHPAVSVPNTLTADEVPLLRSSVIERCATTITRRGD